jgi:transposase-like protein
MNIMRELKLEMAKKYDTGEYKLLELCKIYGVHKDKIQYYYKLYKMWGEKGFEDRDKIVYSRQEKLEAIKTVLSGEKSAQQVALEKCIPNPRVVQDWVNLFKKKGEEGIQVSRGRKRYLLHEERQKYLAEIELNERLQFLEMENDYLKKSLALISKKSKRSKQK